MSSFGSSSDFWPLSLYRSSPSSLNSAGMCGPLGNANGFRVVKLYIPPVGFCCGTEFGVSASPAIEYTSCSLVPG